MTRRVAAALALLLCAAAATGAAQTAAAAQALARGVRAYQNLDYDSAAVLLRDALRRSSGGALADTERARALVYLGATELFRDHRDSAAAVFRRLVLLDPRYRPDQLIFPPEVSSLFQEVRLGTRAVAVQVAPVTEIARAGDRLVVRLYASSYHDVAALVSREGGSPLRTLYAGAVGDSLELLWDGRDSTGAPADSGHYLLRVSSRRPDGRISRVVELPLEVRPVRRDTIPLPPPPSASLLLPEYSSSGRSARSLVIGIAAGAVAVALPPLVGGNSDPTAARYVVAAAIGVSGLVGFEVQRRQPIPANIAANQARRQAWELDLEQARAENVRRRSEVRLVVRAGAPRATDSP